MNTPTQSRSKRNVRVYRLHAAKVVAGSAPAAPAALTGVATLPVAAAVGTKVDALTPARAPWPAPQSLHPIQFPTPPPGKSVIKVGLDIDLKRLTSTIQWDHLQPKAARDFQSPTELVSWVREQSAAGHVVYTVYESCGFGYCLHYDLKEAGAISLVITPTLLDHAPAQE